MSTQRRPANSGEDEEHFGVTNDSTGSDGNKRETHRRQTLNPTDALAEATIAEFDSLTSTYATVGESAARCKDLFESCPELAKAPLLEYSVIAEVNLVWEESRNFHLLLYDGKGEGGRVTVTKLMKALRLDTDKSYEFRCGTQTAYHNHKEVHSKMPDSLLLVNVMRYPIFIQHDQQHTYAQPPSHGHVAVPLILYKFSALIIHSDGTVTTKLCGGVTPEMLENGGELYGYIKASVDGHHHEHVLKNDAARQKRAASNKSKDAKHENKNAGNTGGATETKDQKKDPVIYIGFHRIRKDHNQSISHELLRYRVIVDYMTPCRQACVPRDPCSPRQHHVRSDCSSRSPGTDNESKAAAAKDALLALLQEAFGQEKPMAKADQARDPGQCDDLRTAMTSTTVTLKELLTALKAAEETKKSN